MIVTDDMLEAGIPGNFRKKCWAAVFILTAGVLFSAGCQSSDSGASQSAFLMRIRQWRDDAGHISKSAMAALVEKEVVKKLPRMNNNQTPVLFVQGTLTKDGTDSALMLEARFLYSDSDVPVHIPVRVAVLGRIEGGETARRERLLKGVLKDLRDGLVANIRICNGTKKDWVDALDSPEPDEQILALSLLQHYHVESAASKAVALLDDPRTDVALAAVETASELADEKHVNRIIQIANKGGLEVEARCIQVLSQIGGQNAVAWLEMLALGHQNSQMRELSFNALKRLK